MSVLVSLLHSLRFVLRSRASLHLEILALRHQLTVVHRSRRPRLRLSAVDRMLWVWMSHAWDRWRSALHLVKPATVIAWHRRGFRLFWAWKPTPHRTSERIQGHAHAHSRALVTESALGCTADFFVVPTVTFRLLFVLVVLAHDRRRIVHVAVTAFCPTPRSQCRYAADR